MNLRTHQFWESVVKAIGFHHLGPGWIPVLDTKLLFEFIGSVLCSRRFFSRCFGFPKIQFNFFRRSNLTTLVSRRADACRRFIDCIQPNNPLYNIIKPNCAVRLDKPYNLRHESEAKVPYNTIRFRNFVTYKYS